MLPLKLAVLAVFAIISSIAPILTFPQGAAAACTNPNPQYGTVTSTINIPAAATYRIWSRVMVPDAGNTSYLLEIDNNQCYTVGGTTIPTSAWTWVDYMNGNSASKISLALSAGNHTVRLIGSKPNVKVDRVIMVSDQTCVPSGTGDNCDVPDDTTAPQVTLTAPANGATVSGSVPVTANASDNLGVTRVEFYDNSSLIGTDNNAPYSVNWNTTAASNGTHTLTAKAFDAAGNNDTDGRNVEVQNNSLVHPDGALIRPQNNPHIYLMVNGQRQRVGSPAVFASQGFTSEMVRTALAADMNLSQGPDVYFREGVILRGNQPAVYVIDYDNGAPRKRHITSPTAFSTLGYTETDIVKVNDNELPAANGPAVASASVHPDGTIIRASNGRDLYVIEDGKKRYIGSPQVLLSQSYTHHRVKTGTVADNALSNGQNVYFREGTLIKDNNPPVYVIDNDSGTFKKRHILSPQVFLTLGYNNVSKDTFVVPTSALPTQDGPALR